MARPTLFDRSFDGGISAAARIVSRLLLRTPHRCGAVFSAAGFGRNPGSGMLQGKGQSNRDGIKVRGDCGQGESICGQGESICWQSVHQSASLPVSSIGRSHDDHRENAPDQNQFGPVVRWKSVASDVCCLVCIERGYNLKTGTKSSLSGTATPKNSLPVADLISPESAESRFSPQ